MGNLETLLFIQSNDSSFNKDLQQIYIDADTTTRDNFSCNEPIFLEGSYNIGDANKKNLLSIANDNNCDSIDDLFGEMNSFYNELLEEYAQSILDEIDAEFYTEQLFYKQIKYDDNGSEIEHEVELTQTHKKHYQLRAYKFD